MEDFSSQINNLLNSKEGMEQIKAVASALGLGDAPSPPPPSSAPTAAASDSPAPAGIDTNQVMGMLRQLGLGQPSAPGGNAAVPPIDLNMMMQIQKAMSAFAAGSKNVELLRSLRPHLSPARQKKVDDAVKIMQLIQMLPMLKESGLFGSGGGIL